MGGVLSGILLLLGHDELLRYRPEAGRLHSYKHPGRNPVKTTFNFSLELYLGFQITPTRNIRYAGRKAEVLELWMALNDSFDNLVPEMLERLLRRLCAAVMGCPE